ncbi:dephospho-CoA kinase [Deferribacterales bacterium RsTz2092]|nr:dephospho-CoA kinase [Deferribacterales bacterium]
MLIGLTGGMASGKNYIASLFEKRGCYIIDADNVARVIIAPDGSAYDAVIALFSSDILAEDIIDRKKLREITANDPANLKKLNEIMHPAIKKYVKDEIARTYAKDSKAVIIYNAPLLIEATDLSLYDKIIVVYCDEETQLERLKSRGYPPYEEALKLLAQQMPFSDKRKYADYIINNSGSQEQAEKEVAQVWGALTDIW